MIAHTRPLGIQADRLRGLALAAHAREVAREEQRRAEREAQRREEQVRLLQTRVWERWELDAEGLPIEWRLLPGSGGEALPVLALGWAWVAASSDGGLMIALSVDDQSTPVWQDQTVRSLADLGAMLAHFEAETEALP